MKRNNQPILLLALFLTQCFLFTAAPLEAQTRGNIIGLHPFRAPSEFNSFSLAAYRQAVINIPQVSDNAYTVFTINLDNLPADVPQGGFPPWICPSPSITGNSAHVITGEISEDLEIPGAIRLRFYLWRLENGRLLGSDEMTIEDEEGLAGLPYFLEWVLSWIVADTPPPAPVLTASGTDLETHWLYLGLRGGGGYAQWTFDHRSDPASLVREVTSFMNANIALQISLQLARFFEIQTELNFISNFGPVINHDTRDSDGYFYTMDFNIPILAKFVLQSGRLKTGIFGGAYLHIPLTQTGSDTAVTYYDYRADIPGFIAGLSTAWRINRGSLFLDARIEYDGHWFNQDLEKINYRNITSVNIGYEIGFFRK